MSRSHPIKIESWVYLGAFTMAAIAGYINVCMLGFFHVGVSHMTGAISQIGIDLVSKNYADLKLLVSILGAFLMGSTFSGAIIGRRQLGRGTQYGAALVAEGIIITTATVLLLRGHRSGVTLIAMACGIQNAMATTYYGLVLRTTHVTGTITDMGILIGHLFKYRRIRLWKLALLTLILSGFTIGGILGAFAMQGFGMGALALAAACCLVGGATRLLTNVLSK